MAVLTTILLSLISISFAQLETGIPPKLPVCLSFEEPMNKCKNVNNIYKHQRSMMREDRNNRVDWSNVVFLMIMHESAEVDSLINGHFETWLKHTGKGLDIVFITDESDTRSEEEIIPNAFSFMGKIHVYKSPAEFDDKHIRFKVIDTFRQAEAIFKDEPEKKYFIKVDTDTFPIAENLLAYLNKVDFATKDKPALFGKGVCSPKTMCYAAGALYGMNRLGLYEINKYFAAHPKIHLEENHVVGPGRNLMVHEDYMVSYAYRQATGYPVISNSNVFNYHIEREGTGTEDHPPICYHKVKTAEGLYEYQSLLYDPSTQKLRRVLEVKDIWENKKESFPYLAKSASGKW